MTDMNITKEIITVRVFPPIPDRSHDWYARLSFHDGDTDLFGEGETEHDAVVDLIIKANEYEGDGSEQEVVQDLAIAALTLPVTSNEWERKYIALLNRKLAGEPENTTYAQGVADGRAAALKEAEQSGAQVLVDCTGQEDTYELMLLVKEAIRALDASAPADQPKETDG